MRRPLVICLSFLISLMFLQCKNDSATNTSDGARKILEYKYTQGWTGAVSIVEIYGDKSAVKLVDSIRSSITFSEQEKMEIDSLLSDFSTLKRIYEPEGGAWMDMSLHDVVRFTASGSDTVSIYEPVDSQDVPGDLRDCVNVLLQKISGG